MGVLLSHIVNIALVMLSHAVSESKTYIKEGLENTVVCHFPMLENTHF